MLKLCCVGAGYFSQFHYEAWSRISDVNLVGLCDLDAASAKAKASGFPDASTFSDFVAMLDAQKPDLVDIITPPPSHAEFVLACAERGIPTICQKAFCTSFDEAKSVVSKVQESGGTLAIHENFRFQPWYREIRRLIDDDYFGAIFSLSFRLRPGDGQGPSAYLERQPYFQTMPRFLVHETAVHWLDTFRFLQGPVTSVYADLRQLNPAIAGEDAGVILFQHGEGIRSLFDGNRLSDHVADNRRLTMGEALIEGEKGSMTLSGDGSLQFRAFGSNEWIDHDYTWQNRGFGGDCVFNLQRHVVDHLLEGSPLENEASDYLTVLKTEEAVYRSAETGQRITL